MVTSTYQMRPDGIPIMKAGRSCIFKRIFENNRFSTRAPVRDVADWPPKQSEGSVGRDENRRISALLKGRK